MKHFLFLYLICFIFITQNYAQIKKTADPSSLDKGKYKGEIIFIYASKACGCTKVKCVRGKNDLQSILTNKKYNKIKLTEIDQSLKRKEAGEVLKKYNLFSIPSFFILDKNGDLYYKGAYPFNREKCIQTLEDILAGRGIKKSKKKIKVNK